MRDRILELDKLKSIPKSELFIVSTYFTSKNDPQRREKIQNNNFEYLSKWYISIIDLKLTGIVFHDSLTEEFVSRFSNKNIYFIKCILNDYSLNDERFFIYLELLNIMENSDYFLFTDINDVVVNKNPLSLFKSRNKLFLGRDNVLYWGGKNWTRNKLICLYQFNKFKIDTSFVFSPVINAGLIGGSKSLLINLFQEMNEIFLQIGPKGNNNMVVFNFVIYNLSKSKNKFTNRVLNLLPFNFAIFLFRIIEKFAALFFGFNPFLLSKHNEEKIENDIYFSGFPFNNMYKTYSWNEEIYLIHK
jgi:hypothetical protein